MKQKSVCKAVENCGLTIEIKQHHNTMVRCIVHGLKCRAEWFYDIGDEEISVCVYRHGAYDDLMSDYFPGWYPKTIKHLIQSLTSDKY